MKTLNISTVLRTLTIGALAFVMVAFVLPTSPISAASAVTVKPATITVTQAQINSSLRVTHPANRRFSSVSIVLLTGQAQVNSTYTQTNGTTIALSSIWSPVVRYGRIDWVFVSATANGTPTSADRVRDHRFGLRDSVNDFVRAGITTQFGLYYYRDTAVTVSPDGVVVSANVYVR